MHSGTTRETISTAASSGKGSGRARRWCESPVGPLYLEADAEALRVCEFSSLESVSHGASEDGCDAARRVLEQTLRELHEYFRGERHEFTLPLAPTGTAFQQRVWRALRQIPYGSTWTYQRLATAIGSPKACRAVGAANGKNPIPVIIPCHRVIGSNGALTGFGGGLERKRWLLEHEAASIRSDYVR